MTAASVGTVSVSTATDPHHSCWPLLAEQGISWSQSSLSGGQDAEAAQDEAQGGQTEDQAEAAARQEDAGGRRHLGLCLGRGVPASAGGGAGDEEQESQPQPQPGHAGAADGLVQELQHQILPGQGLASEPKFIVRQKKLVFGPLSNINNKTFIAN